MAPGVEENPFVDDSEGMESSLSDGLNPTLTVGRTASLTLGTDSLVVLGEEDLWRDCYLAMLTAPSR